MELPWSCIYVIEINHTGSLKGESGFNRLCESCLWKRQSTMHCYCCLKMYCMLNITETCNPSISSNVYAYKTYNVMIDSVESRHESLIGTVREL